MFKLPGVFWKERSGHDSPRQESDSELRDDDLHERREADFLAEEGEKVADGLVNPVDTAADFAHEWVVTHRDKCAVAQAGCGTWNC